MDEVTDNTKQPGIHADVSFQNCRILLSEKGGDNLAPFKKFEFFTGEYCYIGLDTNGEHLIAETKSELAEPVVAIRRHFKKLDGKRVFSYAMRCLGNHFYVNEFGYRSGKYEGVFLDNDRRYHFDTFTLSVEIDEDFVERSDLPDWNFDDFDIVKRYEVIGSKHLFSTIQLEVNGSPTAVCGAPDLFDLRVCASFNKPGGPIPCEDNYGRAEVRGISRRESGWDAILTWPKLELVAGDLLTFRYSLGRDAGSPVQVSQVAPAQSRKVRFGHFQRALATVRRLAGRRGVEMARRAMLLSPAAVSDRPGSLSNDPCDIAMEVTINGRSSFIVGDRDMDHLWLSFDVIGSLGPDTNFRYEKPNPPIIRLFVAASETVRDHLGFQRLFAERKFGCWWRETLYGDRDHCIQIKLHRTALPHASASCLPVQEQRKAEGMFSIQPVGFSKLDAEGASSYWYGPGRACNWESPSEKELLWKELNDALQIVKKFGSEFSNDHWPPPDCS
ncbi:MAG: hypothetical protein AAFM91_13430 [Pseudomonadota bacterium]